MAERAVRAVLADDVPAVAGTLGRAFLDDPVISWILRDHGHRTRSVAALFTAMTRLAHLPHGGCELLVDGTDVLGAALWDPPGRWRMPWWRELRAAPAMLGALRSRIGVGLGVEHTMQRVHPKEPHWYLAVLGTEPQAQGTGVGGELLRSRLRRCDADRMPAYLESSKDTNVPYYERFGFRVTREIVLPRGGPPLWAMWREPSA